MKANIFCVPNEVLRDEILPFLSLKELASLDTANCNNELRTNFLQLTLPGITHNGSFRELDPSVLKWLRARKMTLKTLNLNETTVQKDGERLTNSIRNNKLEVFLAILQTYFDPVGKQKSPFLDLDMLSCLHIAVRNRRLEMVERLIAAGVDINGVHKDYSHTMTTHLFESVTYTYLGVDIAKRLLLAGADPNKGSLNKKSGATISTPLNSAVEHENAECVQLLIDNGADLNLKDEDGYTPLVRAVEKDNSKIVEILLKSGADKTIKGPSGRALVEIARSGSMKWLLTRKHTEGNWDFFSFLFKS